MADRPGSIPFEELYIYYYGSQYIKYVGGENAIIGFYIDHTNDLIKKIQSEYKMSQKDLQKLENDYNELIQQRLNLIKTLTGTDQKLYKIKGTIQNDIMSLMVSKLLASKSGLSQQIVDAIIQHLEWDEKKGSFQYKGGALFTKTSIDNTDAKLKKAIGDATQWRETDSIRTRLGAIANALPKDLDSSILNSYQARIDKCQNDLAKAIEAEKKAGKSGNRLHVDIVADIATGATAMDIANAIYQEMDNMRIELRSVASINNSLAAYFTEFLGHLVAKSTSQYTAANLMKEIDYWAKHGLGTTGASKDNAQLQLALEKIEWLDQDVLKSLYSGSNASGIVIKEITPNGERYSLREINSDINNGKTDAEFVLTTTENKKEKLNISYKTTSLAPELANGEYDQIGLQGDSTSLLTYLLGAGRKFARHTLNLMVERENENNDEYQFTDSNLDEAREKMMEALKLQMLYSALSGADQGRKGQQANILAIYDKGAKDTNFRVKFYTYDSIINEAHKDLNNSVILSHDLSKRFKQNFKEPKYATWDENQPLAMKRVTEVIAEARNTQLSVAIAKNVLRNLKSNS